MIYLQTLPPPRICWSANIPTTTGKTTDTHKRPREPHGSLGFLCARRALFLCGEMQGGRASIQEKGGGAEWRRRPFYTTHLPLLQLICPYALPPRRPRPWRARKLLRHIYPLPLPQTLLPQRARKPFAVFTACLRCGCCGGYPARRRRTPLSGRGQTPRTRGKR